MGFGRRQERINVMIVITTPTGAIGNQVLEQTLRSGEPIRVIVRDPSRIQSQTRKRVEVVRKSMHYRAVACRFLKRPPLRLNPNSVSHARVSL